MNVEDGDTTAVAVIQYSNYNSPELVEYTVGALSNTQSEVFQGVDLAMRHMNLYGKAYIIMAHSLAQEDYYPWVAEIEVVSTQRSEEHTSELQSRPHLVCRLLLEKKKKR